MNQKVGLHLKVHLLNSLSRGDQSSNFVRALTKYSSISVLSIRSRTTVLYDIADGIQYGTIGTAQLIGLWFASVRAAHHTTRYTSVPLTTVVYQLFYCRQFLGGKG